MTSPGQILKKERVAQKRSLQAIAKELCIAQSYLAAIESDDLKNLPGTFFYKSFVKQYSMLLGLESSRLQAGVDELVSGFIKESEPQQPEPSPSWNAVASQVPAIRVPDPIIEAANKLDISKRSLGISVAGLVVALGAGSGVYAWLTQPAPQVAEVPPAAQSRTSQATPQDGNNAVTEQASITDVDAAALTESADNPPFDFTTTTGSDGVRHVVLNLSAKEETWISITSGGKRIFSGVLEPSETKTLTGIDAARMKVGNAGGIDVKLNGRQIGPIGESGQVRVVDFTPETYEIVKPVVATEENSGSL